MEILCRPDFPGAIWERGDPQNESNQSVRFIWVEQDLHCSVWQRGQSEICPLG